MHYWDRHRSPSAFEWSARTGCHCEILLQRRSSADRASNLFPVYWPAVNRWDPDAKGKCPQWDGPLPGSRPLLRLPRCRNRRRVPAPPRGLRACWFDPVEPKRDYTIDEERFCKKIPSEKPKFWPYTSHFDIENPKFWLLNQGNAIFWHLNYKFWPYKFNFDIENTKFWPLNKKSV